MTDDLLINEAGKKLPHPDLFEGNIILIELSVGEQAEFWGGFNSGAKFYSGVEFKKKKSEKGIGYWKFHQMIDYKLSK